ncbi:thiamine pyrophosphokinase [Kluyveromyces marxianus]|uniref:Thiamine pyrophosphokinase n=1 Tax=Kluyveromyces marxianus TaxID=4911 RepID=A0ABX6ETD3_KLUMA|nr:thiamine pyrophosphokinase [Kluyveromyces marxianus]BAP70552.1 thiamine pyrophosphokinase [Kluyveromyces marxianus]
MNRWFKRHNSTSNMSRVIENADREDIRIEGDYDGTIELDQWFNPKAEHSVLLILNQKIELDHSVFEKLWNRYSVKVCADGGANRLYDYFCGDNGERYMPDVIAGDMDSIREEVRLFYETHGKTVVIEQKTQYSTDFSKSINAATLVLLGVDLNAVEIGGYDGVHKLYEQADKSKLTSVPLLILNGIDGRFDQTIHSMVQFYSLQQHDPYYKVCFLTTSDMIILIPSSEKGYWIKVNKMRPMIGNCGLLPLAGPTNIKRTRGLKWDVENWCSSIAEGQVSSSNRFVGDSCCIACDVPIVMNIELRWNKIIVEL